MHIKKAVPVSLSRWRYLKVLAFTVMVSGNIFAQPLPQIIDLDKDWKFHLGDAPGAEQVSFDDGNWRQLNVPHDWSIEGSYDSLATTKRGGGYLPAGIGWYRNTLKLPAAAANQKLFIEFEGVMANSDVWINGQLLGHRPFGYLPLLYDITDHVNPAGGNIIVVKADNTVQPASRWYTGAGIYRHVMLHVKNPVHLDRWGVFISTPQISAEKATVKVSASVTNTGAAEAPVQVQTTITSPTGKLIKSSAVSLAVAAGKTMQCEQQVMIDAPRLWDLETPELYKAITTVFVHGQPTDVQENSFGIREAKFESETGFWLNGKNIKIMGACVHHDGGALGSAVPASVWARRISRLKAIGVNALRGAHCPMQKEFYDLCDKMGILIMDETFDTWTAAKPNGEKAYNLYFKDWWETDTRAQIVRVRNHPSVVIYSLGNEIRDNLNSEEGRQRFLDLRRVTKEMDSTRPLTMALFQANRYNLYTNGFSELLDVIGQNYAEKFLLAAWEAKPGRKIIGTENTPSRSAWLVMRDNPAYSGEFVWTGFDYLGEADWPKVSWNTGLFDRNGGWKPSSWERQSWWTTQPMAHIVRTDDGGRGLTDDWTAASDTVKSSTVFVYSNCDEVELYLNGTSLGKQAVPDDDAPNKWVVTYAPGQLKVIGRKDGKDVAAHAHQSAGTPAKLLLHAEARELAHDWEEVMYITATVADKNNLRHPNSNHQVTFSISGPGEIISVDNNDVYSHEPYKTDKRTAYKGQVVAIIRATAGKGTIKIKATADGLAAGELAVKIIE